MSSPTAATATITWALLPALLLGLLPTAGAAVLCVGADGHAEMESMLAPCCASGTGMPTAFTAGHGSVRHGCRDCADIRLDRPARLPGGHAPATAGSMVWCLHPVPPPSPAATSTPASEARAPGSSRRPPLLLAVQLRL